jgi:hypothetical protein
MRAGKHVICEKPFTGYFGRADDRAPIGQHMPKALMYQRVMVEMEETCAAIRITGWLFLYAEDWVYAPAGFSQRADSGWELARPGRQAIAETTVATEAEVRRTPNAWLTWPRPTPHAPSPASSIRSRGTGSGPASSTGRDHGTAAR